MKPPRFNRFLCLVALLLASAPALLADSRVAVTASASPAYTERKFGPDGKPKLETYVFMQGHYFEGMTVDGSIEKMPFRRIAEYLAPELSKQQFMPTKKIAEADLLVVVHWGTTLPYVRQQEMTGQLSTDTSTSFDTFNRSIRQEIANMDPMDGNRAADVVFNGGNKFNDDITSAMLAIGDNSDSQRNMDRLMQLTDQIGKDTTRGTNLTLLGYSDDMHRLGKAMWTTEQERTLRDDLDSERYFIILQAYDLKVKPEAGTTRRPVWTMHLNISSPGNNFRTAMDRMSLVAGTLAGRTTGEVVSIRNPGRIGTVKIAPLIILGEAK